VGQRVGTCEDCKHRKGCHPRYQISQIRGTCMHILNNGQRCTDGLLHAWLPRQIPTFLSHRSVRPMRTVNSDETTFLVVSQASHLKASIKLGVQCGLLTGFELFRLCGVSRGLCEWIANQTELWRLLCVAEWPNTRMMVCFAFILASARTTIKYAYYTGLLAWCR
jgi:hypothetical protein